MGNWFSSTAVLDKIIAEQKETITNLNAEIARLRLEKSRNLAGPLTKISREKLLSWIDNQLDMPENNIGFVPDKIERKLKTQIYTTILNMLDYILETTTVDFMGQTIKFDITSEKSNISDKK